MPLVSPLFNSNSSARRDCHDVFRLGRHNPDILLFENELYALTQVMTEIMQSTELSPTSWDLQKIIQQKTVSINVQNLVTVLVVWNMLINAVRTDAPEYD
jgi:hypothetical protein